MSELKLEPAESMQHCLLSHASFPEEKKCDSAYEQKSDYVHADEYVKYVHEYVGEREVCCEKDPREL